MKTTKKNLSSILLGCVFALFLTACGEGESLDVSLDTPSNDEAGISDVAQQEVIVIRSYRGAGSE